MFAKYQLDISDDFYKAQINKPEHIEKGQEMYKSFGDESHRCLRSFIFEKGMIDGTALKKHWFGIESADVFISHSHRDLNKVIAFAGWLYNNFKLKAFIDSCTWGYADELLKLIDDKYCWNKSNQTYDYTTRNYTTSHVHMMLSTALTEMIDSTECIIFYKTPNSIVISEEIECTKSGKKDKTISPWIYHELSISSMLRRQKPQRVSAILEHHADFAQESLQISHDIGNALKEMPIINHNDLIKWEKTYQKSEHALDTLYRVKPF